MNNAAHNTNNEKIGLEVIAIEFSESGNFENMEFDTVESFNQFVSETLAPGAPSNGAYNKNYLEITFEDGTTHEYRLDVVAAMTQGFDLAEEIETAFSFIASCELYSENARADRQKFLNEYDLRKSNPIVMPNGQTLAAYINDESAQAAQPAQADLMEMLGL